MIEQYRNWVHVQILQNCDVNNSSDTLTFHGGGVVIDKK